MYVFLLYWILGIGAFWELFQKNKKSKMIAGGVALLVALFFICRYNLGPDMSSYEVVFEMSSHPLLDIIRYDSHRNPAFNFLLFFSKYFFHEFRFFILICNAISIGLCGYVIYKKSQNILLSVILFIGSGILEMYYSSGIRQMLGMAVFLFGYYQFVPKKQYGWYYVSALIAVGFHEALLPAFLVPLMHKRLNRYFDRPVKYIGIGFVVSAFVYLVTTYLVVDLARPLIDGLPPFWHILFYFAESSKISYIGLAMEIVFACMIVGLYLLMDKEKQTDMIRLGVAFTVLSFFFYLAFCGHSVVSRLTDAMQVIFVILIPNMLDGISNKATKIIGFVFVLLLNGFLLWSDLTYKVERINAEYTHKITLEEYPYVFLFDKANVEYYMETIDE